MGDCRLCLQYQSWLSILCAVQLIQTMAPKGFSATLTPPQLLRDHRGHRRCCANDCNASCYEYEVTQANLSFQAARSLMGAHCCHNCWIHQNLPDYATWAGLPYHNEYCEQDMLGPTENEMACCAVTTRKAAKHDRDRWVRMYLPPYSTIIWMGDYCCTVCKMRHDHPAVHKHLKWHKHSDSCEGHWKQQERKRKKLARREQQWEEETDKDTEHAQQQWGAGAGSSGDNRRMPGATQQHNWTKMRQPRCGGTIVTEANIDWERPQVDPQRTKACERPPRHVSNSKVDCNFFFARNQPANRK